MRKSATPATLLVAGALMLFAASLAFAHCQIPCGIYTDEMRFAMIEEHLQTIEKSMAQIEELSAAAPVNYNQLVRWVTNKDTHAQEIQDIVNAYFLTQRIKPVAADAGEKYDEYVKSLELLHGLLVNAMKCKQTTDAANVAACRTLLEEFRKLYFKDKEHTHE